METLPSKTIKYRFTRGCHARRKVTTNLQFSRFRTVGWENPPIKKKTPKQEVFLKYAWRLCRVKRLNIVLREGRAPDGRVGEPSTKKDLQTGSLFKIRVEGFEPPTFWFVAKRSIQLGYTRIYEIVFCVSSLDRALIELMLSFYFVKAPTGQLGYTRICEIVFCVSAKSASQAKYIFCIFILAEKIYFSRFNFYFII